MRFPLRFQSLSQRLLAIASVALVVGVFGTGALTTGAFISVHETAKSEFCNSCHIMEPFYESWRNSSHKHVPCIECHYEPGAMETTEGKFKALSQLAKYVTRTAGTKPWAEVSDQSCMRSGCHSVRMLDGPVDFGRVRFDHRHHLLESRRGRRLRCVSCHSQIVQGEHIAVTESVCFACHFMPGADGKPPERTSDCMICHGPPKEPVAVAGRDFVHDGYIARGVRCTECHDPVIQGKGEVSKERCHSCHGETGHIERIGETAFMHEKHVTEHKVECFECHAEIQHGLLPLEPPKPATGEGCGSCHVDAHNAPRLLYAGTGAFGVPDAPSRMYQTRIVCRACHTGRTEPELEPGAADAAELADASTPADATLAEAAPAEHGMPALAAKAGEADCIHCHGPSYDGVLADWQGSVGAELERLRPRIASFADKVKHGTRGKAAELLGQARANFELVERDGSKGVHNPRYAMDALVAAAERLDALAALLDPEKPTTLAAGFPFRSSEGCSSCHLAPERYELEVHGREFSHAKHLAGGARECSSCHSTQEHGKPAFAREQCASCHHQEQEGRDPSDCNACHTAQVELRAGKLAGFAEAPDSMADLECGDCHGQPPAITRPKPAMCVLCHEKGYDAMPAQWLASYTELRARVESLLGSSTHAQVVAKARAALKSFDADGSHGAHNFALVKQALESLAKELEAP